MSAKKSWIIAAAGVVLVSAAWAQTAPPAGQIAAGSTGSISPAQGVTHGSGGTTTKILDGALTAQTRRTLQDAMNSTGAGEVTLGPGETARLDGTNAVKVDLDTLPAPVKSALAGALSSPLGAGH